MATDRTFTGGAGGTGTDYYTGANWSSGSFPGAQFNNKAVIGTTGAGQPTGIGLLTATAIASTTPDIVTGGASRQSGGLTLGREATSEGTLNIVNGGTARFAFTAQGATAGTDGAAYLGANNSGSGINQGGIGHLNISGNGTLIATGLFVEGETVGANRSSVTLSDTATVTLGPVVNVFITPMTPVGIGDNNLRFGRDLTVTGPGVNFTNTGHMEILPTNVYNANITSATAHSTLKTTGNLTLGGPINITFSGLGSNPAVGETWDLFDYGGNLFGAFSNAPFNTPITVSGLPQPLEDGAQFRLRRVNGGANGKLIQLIQMGVVILEVNRDTGEMKLTNPHGTEIDIDAYRIHSELGSLLPTYKGISGAPAADTGWEKPITNSATDLAELKSMPFTTFDLQANPSVTLGSGAGKGFDKFAVAADVANFGTDGEDLEFTYSTPDGPVTGFVKYIGTKFENNLVLRVANSGQAFLKNDSLETLTFDGYTIQSSTGALDSATWTGLGSGWLKTDLEPDALSETNLSGSITLEPEDEVPIGDIGAFATSAAQAGLSMKFILAVGLGGSGPLVGDYNEDGSVDAADYVVWRKTDGSAQGFNDWRANFGNTGGGLAPPETTFRTGSVVFDTPAGSGGGSGGGSAVPEPSAAWLALVGLAGVLFSGRHWARNSRQLVYVTAAHNSRTQGQDLGGERNMSRPFGLGLIVAAGLGITLICAQTARAVPQGALLVNYDFADPGPLGQKVVAFDEDPDMNGMSDPIPGIIPGWTFTGPGTETFGDGIPGDSGTEGSGSIPVDNEMVLSVNDGKAYQVASGFTIQSITANEIYKFAFDARDIFTIDVNGAGLADSGQLTARFFYGAWEEGQRTLLNQVVDLTGTMTRYEFTIPHTDALLQVGSPALSQTLGIEFTTTSKNRNVAVDKSWSHIDNVVMEIAPVLPGDLNGDGSLTSADYNILAGNIAEDACHTSPSGIRGCPFEADGDLTGDYVVDLNDFRAFKTLFAAGSGSGGVAGSNSGVPEPSAIALLVLAGMTAAVMTRGGRRRTFGRALVLAIAAFGASFALTAESKADLLFYDPFLIGTNPAAGEYLADAPLSGQNPLAPYGTIPDLLTGPWTLATANPNTVLSKSPPGLNYVGAASEGGSIGTVQDPANNQIDNRIGRKFKAGSEWTDATVGTYYISWVHNFGGGDFMGFRAMEFWRDPNGEIGDGNLLGDLAYNQYYSPLGDVQTNPQTARFYFQHQIIDGSPVFVEDGNTHLFVMKFELSDQNNADTISVFLDPASAAEPEIPNLTIDNTNVQLGILGIGQFGGFDENMNTVDELRIATTFADAVPDGLPIPGDADGDGDVDLDDYAIIRNNFHRTDAAGPFEGDVAKSDGKLGFDSNVDIGDFWLWKHYYEIALSGGGGAGGGANVPEPATAVFAVVAILALGCSRRSFGRPS